MNKSKVKIANAIATLKTNRAEHIKEYRSARKNYKKVAKRALTKRMKILDSEEFDFDQFELIFRLPKPVSYADSFDTAIAQLEWALEAGEEVVELDQNDFNRFILNHWEWAQQFAASTMSYNAR